MAITGRSKAEAGARGAESEPAGDHCRSRRAVALSVAVTTAASASLLAAPAARAERWSVDADVSSQLMWTSNGDISGASTGGRSDTLLDLRPRIALRGEGARLKVFGSAAVDAVTYAHGTQPSRLQPEADLNARLEAVERLLFLEAAVRAQQTSENPFGLRPEGGSTRNALTTVQTRFSPSIEAAAGPDLRYRLRSDNTWTNEYGATTLPSVSTAGGFFGRHSARLEHDPRPLGWRLEAERSETRYDDPLHQPLILDLARASVVYQMGEDFSAGVRAGHERNNFATSDRSKAIFGLEAKWQPSPRTTLAAFDERRFFGNAWSVAFDHRMPQLAWNMVVSRTLDTTPQSLFDLPATNNVAALLDAMFTTRYPDPIERARIVQNYIAQQGLPSATPGPITLYSQRLSIVTLRSARVAFTGVRNSLALSAFQSRTEDAPDTGSLATGDPTSNNTQYGASITWSYRLSALIGLNASADASRITSLQAVTPDRTTQRTARLQLNIQAAPKTSAFLGLRYRKIESNVVPSGRDGAVFVGLDHHF